MQYLKCIASKPGLFENVTLDFSDNLIIVYGKNGSGKTLLVKSLIESIFRKFSSDELLPDEVWDSIYVDVMFSLSEKDKYRVTSNGSKFYTIQYINGKEEIVLFSENVLENVDLNNSIQLSLQKEGIPFELFLNNYSKQVYINSSLVPSPSDINPVNILDYLSFKNIMLNDKSGFFQYSGNFKGQNQGELYNINFMEKLYYHEKIQREIVKREQLFDIGNSRVDKLNKEKRKINKEIRDIQKSIETLNNQKSVLLKVLGDLDRVEKLNNELINMKDQVELEKKNISLATTMSKDIKTQFSHFIDHGIEEISNLDELQEIFNEIRNLNEEIENISFKRTVKRNRIIKFIAGLGVFALTGISFLMIKNDFSFYKDTFLLIAIVSAFFGLSAFMVLYLLLSSKKKSMENLRSEKEEKKEAIKKKIKGDSGTIDNDEISNFYEYLLQYFEDYIEYTEKVKEYLDLKKSLKDKESLKELMNELNSLKNREESIKVEIDKNVNSIDIINEVEIDDNEINTVIDTIDREIESLGVKISDKEKIISQIDKELDLNPHKNENTGQLVLEGQKNEKLLKKLQANEKALKFINEILIDAEEKREEKQLKKLVKNSLEKFNFLTGNQYITKIDERGIQEIITDNKIRMDFNPALIHSILLSIKLSLTDFIVENGVALPLLIDDPFYNMDDERVQRLRILLNEVAKKRQIILFTHQKDKKDWGNYIEL